MLIAQLIFSQIVLSIFKNQFDIIKISFLSHFKADFYGFFFNLLYIPLNSILPDKI